VYIMLMVWYDKFFFQLKELFPEGMKILLPSFQSNKVSDFVYCMYSMCYSKSSATCMYGKFSISFVIF